MGLPLPATNEAFSSTESSPQIIITPYNNKRQDCFYLWATINERLWATHWKFILQTSTPIGLFVLTFQVLSSDC